MMRCGGLLPLLISFVIALNIKQTDSSKQDHQLKTLIEDNKERLIEVFSELFSEGEGEGEKSKEWVEEHKESLIEVFSEVFSKKEGKGDSSKQYHQLKEWIKDNKESLTELFSKKESKDEGEGEKEPCELLPCPTCNVVGTEDRGPAWCSSDYVVCGSDGKTYENDCEIATKNCGKCVEDKITVKHKGKPCEGDPWPPNVCGITLHHPPPPDVAVKNEKKRIELKLAEYSKAKVKSKAICARIEKATTKAEKEKANADCDESHNKTLAICSNGECDLFRKPRNWTLEEHIFRGGCGNRTEPGIYYDGNDIRTREGVATAVECSQHCADEPKCFGWSHFAPELRCYLKSSLNGPSMPLRPIEYPGTTSGPKPCKNLTGPVVDPPPCERLPCVAVDFVDKFGRPSNTFPPPTKEDAVCGSDGKTYESDHRLSDANCNKCVDDEITVKHKGECKVADPVCKLPPRVVGPCKAAYSRWTFSKNKCVKFIYGGCSGNANNFKTERDCNKACGGCFKPCTRDCPQVCGSDGKTYCNACVLENEACGTDKNITIEHSGTCESSKNDSHCIIEEEIGYNGYDVKPSKTKTTANKQECADYSASTTGSLFWTWNKETKKCFLKSSKVRTAEHRNFVSGNSACGSDSSSIEEECTGCKQWKINQTDAAIKSCNYENGTKFNPEPEDTIPSGSKCELHCKNTRKALDETRFEFLNCSVCEGPGCGNNIKTWVDGNGAIVDIENDLPGICGGRHECSLASPGSPCTDLEAEDCKYKHIGKHCCCGQCSDSHWLSLACVLNTTTGAGSWQPTDSLCPAEGCGIEEVGCLEDWERALNLGEASLDTSAKSECAQARFILGLLAVHNFQYEMAMEIFEKADATEQSESGRGYPMAMWGAAMATTQILWQYSDCKKGKEYMKRIPMEANWITEKEKAYIETGFALYPKNLTCDSDKDQNTRERRFMEAMDKVVTLYPGETEAALFKAVSSEAVAAQRNFSFQDEGKGKEARIKVLETLEERIPNHSGLLHYITHVFDTPELYTEGNRIFLHEMKTAYDQRNHAASMGIRAAEKYPRVANSSCHALHMPSHIYMRIGDWTNSLESNLASIKACDAFTKQRGIRDEDLYDKGNLYHSVEYAQYDYLQRGQYEKAQEMLSRIDSIISKLDGKEQRDLIWIQQRMNARQKLESLGVGSDSKLNLNRSGTLLSEDEYPISDGEMNYAAISEVGLLLLRLLQGIKESNNPLVASALKQSEKLINILEPRKSTQEYVKYMVPMMQQMMIGVKNFAKNVRVKGPFKKATDIQKKHMIQSSATPTLLYMPSYEIYGFVLLVTKEYKKAKEEFEASLEEKMGRTLSLLGLARAHSLLGNTKQATFFYQYLRSQLQQADEGNLAVREAENWASSSKSKIEAEKLRDNWFWPNYLPVPLIGGCDKPCTKDCPQVCGSDGSSYCNKCLLKNEACRTGRNITVEHDGKCKEGKYFAVAKGPQTCPPGSEQIKDQEECKQAANTGSLGSWPWFLVLGSWPKVQPYCFLATNGRVHFNMNQNSMIDGFTKSICKRPKTTGTTPEPKTNRTLPYEKDKDGKPVWGSLDG